MRMSFSSIRSLLFRPRNNPNSIRGIRSIRLPDRLEPDQSQSTVQADAKGAFYSKYCADISFEGIIIFTDACHINGQQSADTKQPAE